MMLLFLFVLTLICWALVTLVAWVLSIVFAAALTIWWVLKVWAVICILAFLWDIFSSYKGNKDWY